MSANRKFGRLGHVLEILLYVAGGATVLFMMVYIVVNALSRTLLSYSLPASLEIVQFILMPALATIGFVAATLAHRHVVADLLYDFFPPAGRKWLAFGNLTLCAVTFAVLAWFTLEEAMFALERNFKAGFTDVPSWPMYFFVPISLFISLLLFSRDAWRESRVPVAERIVKKNPGADIAPEELWRLQ